MCTIALYFHIPFCVRKCIYCAFYSVTGIKETDKHNYLKALLAQMKSFPESRPVSSIYFGGGTPNLFGAERIAALLEEVRNQFAVCDDCEITVEINPDSVKESELGVLRRSGVNRLSIGMQSSDPALLRFLGRRHSFADTRKCFESARNVGFRNISLDLLFGLPNQTKSQFCQSLSDAFELGPEHFSVYSIQVEKGTPLYVNRSKLSFPSETEEEEEYNDLCKEMIKKEYVHYEISSFAKGNAFSKHNMHYWMRGDYIGFGPGAHSFWNGKRFSNFPDLQRFMREPLSLSDYPAAERITEEEAIEEEIMLGLRTINGIPAHLVSKEKVNWLCDLGYLRVENDRVIMTERGWRVSNAVIGQLIV